MSSVLGAIWHAFKTEPAYWPALVIPFAIAGIFWANTADQIQSVYLASFTVAVAIGVVSVLALWMVRR